MRWSLVGNLGQPAVAWNSSVGKGTEKWGRNSRPFPTLVQSSLLPQPFCTWGLCGGSDWLYMFKDPFSPDHTQKLEDEWLRYFKKNCKNPKMVSHVFGSVYQYLPTIKYTCIEKARETMHTFAGEKSELGKAGDSPSGGETSIFSYIMCRIVIVCYCDFWICLEKVISLQR